MTLSWKPKVTLPNASTFVARYPLFFASFFLFLYRRCWYFLVNEFLPNTRAYNYVFLLYCRRDFTLRIMWTVPISRPIIWIATGLLSPRKMLTLSWKPIQTLPNAPTPSLSQDIFISSFFCFFREIVVFLFRIVYKQGVSLRIVLLYIMSGLSAEIFRSVIPG